MECLWGDSDFSFVRAAVLRQVFGNFEAEEMIEDRYTTQVLVITRNMIFWSGRSTKNTSRWRLYLKGDGVVALAVRASIGKPLELEISSDHRPQTNAAGNRGVLYIPFPLPPHPPIPQEMLIRVWSQYSL